MIGHAKSTSISFDDVFSDDFVPLMVEYTNAINSLLDKYDTVFFVARKAVLLYYALVANGVINRAGMHANVLSSRALEYACDRSFGTVVVCDDVVVHGYSAECTLRRLRHLSCPVDYLLVAAADPSLVTADLSRTLVAVVRELDAEDIYRFSREIIDYIQASGIPSNMDFPIFHCNSTRETLFSEFDAGCWSDLTTPAQNSKGIESYTILFDVKEWLLGIGIKCRSATGKVRVLYNPGNENSYTVVPLVLLSDARFEEVDYLVHRYFRESGLIDIMRFHKGKDRYKSTYRILEYILSYLLGAWFFKTNGIDCSSLMDLECERILFGKNIVCFAFRGNDSPIHPDGPTVCRVSDDARAKFRLASGVLIGRLLSAEKQAGAWPDSGAIVDANARQVGVTLDEFGEAVNHNFRLRTDETGQRVLTSYALDTLIDKGVLIPRLIRRKQHVERAYRSGESFTVSRRLIAMTAKALYQYDHDCRTVSGANKEKPTCLSEPVANHLAMVFIRWVTTAMGTQDAALSGDDFTYEWSPRTSSLCYEGKTLVGLLVDDLGRMSRREDGTLYVLPVDEHFEIGEDYIDDFGMHFSMLRAHCNALDGDSEQRMEGLLSEIVIGTDRTARLNAIRAQVEHVYDLLVQYPIGRVLLPQAVDEAWSWAQFTVSTTRLDKLLSTMRSAGINATAARGYCKGIETAAVDINKSKEILVRSERLLSELSAQLRVLVSKSENGAALLPNMTLDKMDSAFLRLFDRTQTLARFLSRLKANGYAFSGGDVIGLAIDEDNSVRSIESADIGKLTEPRDGAVLKMLEKLYSPGGLVAVFTDGRARAAYIPMSSEEEPSWDTIYPERLRRMIQEDAKNCCRNASYGILLAYSTRNYVDKSTISKILNGAGTAKLIIRGRVIDHSGNPVATRASGAYSFSAFAVTKKELTMTEAKYSGNRVYGPVIMHQEVENSGLGTGVTVDSHVKIDDRSKEELIKDIGERLDSIAEVIVKDDETLVETIIETKESLIECVKEGQKESAIEKITGLNSLFDNGTPIGIVAATMLDAIRQLIMSAFGM